MPAGISERVQALAAAKSRRSDDDIEVGKTAKGATKYMPANDLANRIARIKATDPAKGLELQRAFQDRLPDSALQRVGLEREKEKGGGLLSALGGFAGGVFDIMDRPSQGILRFLGGASGNTDENPFAGAVRGLLGSGDRIDFRDAVGTDFGGGILGGVANFAGTVLTDPTTYLTFGATGAYRQGLRKLSKELGEETAEKIARKGVINAAERKALTTGEGALSGKALKTFERTLPGGVRFGVGGKLSKNLVKGETIRKPLRAARLIDDAAPGASVLPRTLARRGAAPATRGKTLQSALRGTPGLQNMRDKMTTFADARLHFGRHVGDEVAEALSKAEAMTGIESADAMEVLKNVSKIYQKLDPADVPVLNARMAKAFADNDLSAEVSRLIADGHNEAAETLRAFDRTLKNGYQKYDAQQMEHLAVTAKSSSHLEPGQLFNPAFTDAVTGFTPKGALPTPRKSGAEGGLAAFMTKEAKKAIKEGGDKARRQFSDIAIDPETGRRARGNIIEMNERLKKMPAFSGVDADIIDTNQFRAVARDIIEVNQAGQLDSFMDDMMNITTGMTDTPLVKIAVGDEAPLGYVRIKAGAKQYDAHTTVANDVQNFNRVAFDPASVDEFRKVADNIMQMWKLQATSMLPFSVGFHMRNAMGNLFNNFIAGVNPKKYKEAAGLWTKMQEARSMADEAIRSTGGFDKAAQRSALQAKGEAAGATRQVRPTEPGYVAKPQRAGMRGGLAGLPKIDEAGKVIDDAAFRPKFSAMDLPHDVTSRQVITEFDTALSKMQKAGKVTAEEVTHIKNIRERGVVSSGFWNADIGVSPTAGLYQGDETRMARAYRKVFEDQDAWVMSAGRKMGDWIESNGRIAHYLSKVDEGYDISGSVMSMKKYLFDYSDLTQTEQKIFKRIMPFYTFARKNTPLQFQTAFTQPRKLLGPARLQQALANTAQDEDFMAGNSAMPQWIKDQGMVKGFTPFGMVPQMMWGLDLPSDAAFKQMEPIVELLAVLPGTEHLIPDSMTPEERADGYKGLIGIPGGGLTELAKFMLENGVEKDLFTGAPIPDGQARWLQSLAGSTSPLAAKLSAFMKDLGVLDTVFGGDEMSLDRAGARLLRTTIGVNAQVVDPKMNRSAIYEGLAQLENELDKFPDAPTIAQLRDAGVIPTLEEIKTREIR